MIASAAAGVSLNFLNLVLDKIRLKNLFETPLELSSL